MSDVPNVDLLCMYCMSQKNRDGICPKCNFDEKSYQSSPHHLPLRTILNGKYLIGRVLGEGGFGITYLGRDLNLDLKIAIKEYFPTGFVTRENTTTNNVTPYTGEKNQFFNNGRDKFVDEAKRLAKFYSLPGIVSIKDFFQENGTAYLVMEYVEGETLKQHLSRVGGKVPATEIFELMKPLMNSLIDVHNTGIIHRDISPDNIIITKEGNIKLLDFGAARDFSDSGNKSLSVMLKPGYAPEEQYRSRGVQGPWTDIYALCGTMYKAITGITPDESSERLRSDELRKPSELGIEIHPRQESALMKGMAVFQENRFQSINALMEDLFKIPDQSSYEPEAHIDQAIEKQAQNSSEYKSDLNNQVDSSVEKEIQTTNKFKQKIKIFGSVIVIAIIILTFIGFYVKYSHSGHSGSLGSNVSVQTENDSTNTDTLNTKVVKNSKDNNQGNINTGSTQGEKTDSDKTSSNISTIMSDAGNTSGNIINNGHIAAQGEWIYYSFNGGLDKMKADGSERTEIYPNLNIKSLSIKDDWIYFCNSSDNETLYKIKTDGSNIKKLDDTEYCRCI
ncbi:MAG: protein kinase, partial [Bacteroidota bacterium]|nr:protein kinase [Bacteroidota bacterium]